MRQARLIAAAAGLALALPGTSYAFYGDGARVDSASLERQELADDGSQFADISTGARYVAFQTRARNFFADDDPDPAGQYRVGGIFRRDLAGSALPLVASGDVRDENDNTVKVRGAANPSVSADGRYVAFSTGEALVPADVNDHVDVYVRDMTLVPSAPGAYDLVSAKTGGTVPAGYQAAANPVPKIDAGSDVRPASAISDDGHYVLFHTAVGSNLPDRAAIDTPGGQLFVRDRVAKTTTLVTRDSSSGAPAGGAGTAEVLSGDGSTVAWTGQNAPAQTRFLPGENDDSGLFYYLWRRWATGPTRRVTGVADLDDPGCPPNGTVSPSPTATGPCYGPLTDAEGQVGSISGVAPAISGDGTKVAFLVTSGPRPNTQTGQGLDLWVTDMTPGASRKEGSEELTREGASNDLATGSPIDSVAISGDGSHLAVTTFRTQFVLPALAFVGPRRTFPNTRELYVVDLGQRTIERATRSTDGGEINGDVQASASLSEDGARAAFVSGATNLFFGDANARADVFDITRTPEPPPEPPPPPPPADNSRDVEQNLGADNSGPELTVSARAHSRGVVEVFVRVPGAGTLVADARARVGKRTRSVARARVRAKRRGRVRAVLRLSRRYRAELRRKGRLRARTSLGFTPRGRGSRVRDSTVVTFRQRVPQKPKKR